MRQQRSHQASPGGTKHGWHWQTGAGWQLHLEQGEAAKDLGIRTHCVPLAIARVGHQDWQVLPQNQDGIAAYMSKLTAYIAKHDADDVSAWEQPGNSAFVAAQQVLRRTRPSFAQMVQILLRKSLACVSSDTKRVVLNLPGESEDVAPLKHYLRRPEEEEGLTYLQWLRAYRTDIDPPARYQRARDVALQVHFGDRLKDTFFGQWLVANVPHRRGADLVQEPVCLSGCDTLPCACTSGPRSGKTTSPRWLGNPWLQP